VESEGQYASKPSHLKTYLAQIFPTTDSLPASGLTLQTFWLDCFFWAPRFLFLVFLHYSFFGFM